MKNRFTPLLLISLMISGITYANHPLKVAVATSFLPVMENIKPRLVQQLGVQIEITSETNIVLHEEHLNKPSTTYDLIIFSENKNLLSPASYQEIIKKSSVIIAPHVVLWCPNINMPKRIGLNDVITQANIQSIATPGPISLLTDMFFKNVSKLPPHIQLTNVSNSLTAWRMANTKQVDCAVTFDKWLKPTDQFNYVSTEPVNFRGWVKSNGRYKAQSKQIVSVLSSPLLQAIMMRSTNSNVTLNMQ